MVHLIIGTLNICGIRRTVPIISIIFLLLNLMEIKEVANTFLLFQVTKSPKKKVSAQIYKEEQLLSKTIFQFYTFKFTPITIRNYRIFAQISLSTSSA